MGKITTLRTGKGRNKVKIFLDGKFAFNLEAEVAVKEGLQVGQELSTSEVEALAKRDNLQRCLNSAARYLSYRPRSELELRERLHRRGFADETVKAVLVRLREQGLLDDMAFAQFWADNRKAFRPRSQWLIKSELRQKGVAREIIDEIGGAVDDEDSAYQAALSKARSLSRSDMESFRRRLSSYLRYRGFGYEVINRTIERVWQELREKPQREER